MVVAASCAFSRKTPLPRNVHHLVMSGFQCFDISLTRTMFENVAMLICVRTRLLAASAAYILKMGKHTLADTYTSTCVLFQCMSSISFKTTLFVIFVGRVQDACSTSQTSMSPRSPHTHNTTNHHANSPQTHRHYINYTLHHKRYTLHFRSRSRLNDSVCQVLFYAPLQRGLALSLLMDCVVSRAPWMSWQKCCVDESIMVVAASCATSKKLPCMLALWTRRQSLRVAAVSHMISEQLLFNKKSLMVAALRTAGRENQKARNLTSVQVESWTVTLDKRLRNMFSHVRDGATRSLPWNRSAAKCDDSVSDTQSRSYQFKSRSSCTLELEPTWNCGFSVELMFPWRYSGESSDNAFGIPLDLAATALLPPTDPFFASLLEGYTCAVSSITNEDVFANFQRSASRVKSESLWSGEHEDCHHRLVLCQRVDRCLFASPYEQSRQSCLWGVATFGSFPPGRICKSAQSTPALMRCVEFARPFCEKYDARDTGNSAELKKLRDEAMFDQGVKKCPRVRLP